MKSKKLLTALVILLILASCKEYAPYKTEGVTIDINIKQLSAGFIEAEYKTNKNAYFYCGIMKLDSGQTKPYTNDEHFMVLMLDSAQIEYRQWRHDLLRDNVPYIASFKDHCLEYGTSDNFYIRLVADSTYLLYAFAVDIETNEPVGELFTKVVQTKHFSETNVRFDYRINGRWDYIYPRDTLGEILPNFPYNALTFDSVELRDVIEAFSYILYRETPFWFFAEYFSLTNINYFKPYDNTIFKGIRAELHDDSEESLICFEEGKTYYTGIVSADYVPNSDQVAIYKFKWTGTKMKEEFNFETDTLGMYEW